jgi:hypothetical protein
MTAANLSSTSPLAYMCWLLPVPLFASFHCGICTYTHFYSEELWGSFWETGQTREGEPSNKGMCRRRYEAFGGSDRRCIKR